MTWSSLTLALALGAVTVDVNGMLQRARPGQVIEVPAGIHPGVRLEDRAFNPPVTVRGVGGGRVVIAEHPETGQAAWLTRSSGLRFENITFVSRRLHVLHIDGDPLPQPILSQNIEFTNCEFVTFGKYYGAKLSQSRLLLFDRCRFSAPKTSQVIDANGGCFDAVAVDDFIIRHCVFDHTSGGGVTLMIKGGARNVVVRDSEFHCPGTVAPLFLAGQTDPIYRIHADARYELQNFVFKNNRVYFEDAPPSDPEGLHGVWDSVSNARFLNNEFHNVGQILFVGKKTVQDLDICRNITFNDNKIYMRKQGFSGRWGAVIANQGGENPDGSFAPYLPPSEFHASGNIVYLPADKEAPEIYNLIEKGFEFRKLDKDAAQ